jgi:hypothetical protein
MRRSRAVALLVAFALLVASGLAAFFLLRRPAPAPVPPAPPPASAPAKGPADWHGVLNLYLTPLGALPAGTTRVELTLTEAELLDEAGNAVNVVRSARRLMLQPGTVEKLLNDRVPNGAWASVRLTFSPAGQVSGIDGTSLPVLVERRTVTIPLGADIPVSRTLAAFARLQLEPEVKRAAGVPTIGLAPLVPKADVFLLGGFFATPRGPGQIYVIAEPTLAAAVMKDLKLDITAKAESTTGVQFVPAAGAPAAPAVR